MTDNARLVLRLVGFVVFALAAMPIMVVLARCGYPPALEMLLQMQHYSAGLLRELEDLKARLLRGRTEDD